MRRRRRSAKKDLINDISDNMNEEKRKAGKRIITTLIPYDTISMDFCSAPSSGFA
jgi:hypothetical protein